METNRHMREYEDASQYASVTFSAGSHTHVQHRVHHRLALAFVAHRLASAHRLNGRLLGAVAHLKLGARVRVHVLDRVGPHVPIVRRPSVLGGRG